MGGAGPSPLIVSREFVRAHWRRLASGFFLAALFIGNQGFRSLVANWLELRHLRREISGLERDQARLDERLKRMKSADGSLERMARKDLGFIKPGEIEYRFPPPKSAD